MSQLLSRLDDLSSRVERVIVLVFLSIMSLAVFFDVVHRVASTPEGLILRVLTLFAPSHTETLANVGVPLVATVISWVVCYGALRTASGSTITAPRAALAAVGLTALIALGIFLVLKIFPNGLIWSQSLALGLLLWVALFGATLATKARGHIVMEVAGRLWPPKALPYAKLLSGFVACGFCVTLVLLSFHYTTDFWEQWKEGVGYVGGLKLPKWTVYAAMPVCFSLMGVRFLAYAIGDFLKRNQPAVPEVQS